jgi:hypothetical protein
VATITNQTMKAQAAIDSILESDLSDFTIVAGAPADWSKRFDADGNPKAAPAGNFVVVKTSKPRGISASALKSMGLNNGSIAYSLSGISLENVYYGTFKPSGLVLKFPNGTDAVEKATELLGKYVAKAEKEEAQRTKHRVEAPQRRREASKIDRVLYKDAREKLYAQYGKRNVQSVTARQIGGDDGYQWNVLINGVPFVNGLTQGQVDYYKKIAYQQLVDKHGVR